MNAVSSCWRSVSPELPASWMRRRGNVAKGVVSPAPKRQRPSSPSDPVVQNALPYYLDPFETQCDGTWNSLDSNPMAERRLAIFASGGGSNFQAIHEGWQAGRHPWRPVLVVANRSTAGALERARRLGVATAVFGKAYWGADVPAAVEILARLRAEGVEAVALAGFLKQVPRQLVAAFPGRMLNIHPALLPAFGGPGMYGMRVHEAVHASGCRVSGPTVHLVDEEYDRGPILLQRAVELDPEDDPAGIAARVLAVEHEIYNDALALLAARTIRIEEGRAIPCPVPR